MAGRLDTLVGCDAEDVTLHYGGGTRFAGGLLTECWLHETDQALVDHLWR